MTTRTFYMHTIYGQPAWWCERDRVLYVVSGMGQRATLHRSLTEIRRQQRISSATRTALGYPESYKDYGYTRVGVPA